MNKRIYLVVTPFFPENKIFRGPYVLDQVKALQKNSEFEVIVMKPSRFYHKDKDYEIDGVKVYRFNDYTLPSNICPNMFVDNMSSKSMINKLNEIGVELRDVTYYHCHVNECCKYVLLLKKINPLVKIIVQHHGFDVMGLSLGIFSKYKWHRNLCINYGTSLSKMADLHIGVSKKTLEYLKKFASDGIHNEYVLYNGVDKTIFYPIQSISHYPNKKIFKIGCIANFWPLKDQMTLIKAISVLVHNKINWIKVIFIGSGETLMECMNFVKKEGLSVYFEFREEVMHEQLPEFYRSLDLFVLPSYFEAFGCVYAEAYCCGVPFIAVENQGISEIVEDGNRWMIKKGDYQQLANMIENYITSPSIQKLNIDLDINVLIKQYLDFLNTSL